MTRDFNNIIVVCDDTDIYRNVDDYFKAKGLSSLTQHKDCFEDLINDIGFDKCQCILFEYIHISELLFNYKKDKHFNSSKLQRQSSLKYFTNLNTYDRPNKWDEIGHRMLYANHKLYFETWSLWALSCLAKACARMVVDKYRKG